MLLQTLVGVQTSADGTNPPIRSGKSGEIIAQELHGRFYEQNFRGNIYSFGLSNTTLVAANAIATGLTSSAQPVVGLYNPASSLYNLVVLQALIVTTTVAGTAVSPGGFMWVYSAGNSGVSTGSTPINSKTLVASGSAAKAFAVSTPLTGLTNSLAVFRGSGISTINAAGPATAIHQPISGTVENVDGSIIVPPGGVIGLMNQVATTTVGVSVGIVWEEVLV